MKYYIIAGEASGDLHASNLMASLKQLDGDCKFRCWGGDLMQKQGGTIVKHYRELAFMGFVEVAKNIRTIFNNIKFCKSDIIANRPDALILVDYPGFNLRIAEFAKQQNIRVFYYISPQIWAWKQSRVYSIKRNVDKMFVILPFEKQFYARFGVDVNYVGHPLLDAIKNRVPVNKNNFISENKIGSGKKIVALLPGSRKQEIAKMLPVFLKLAEKYSDVIFILACAPSIDKAYYHTFDVPANVHLVEGQTYDVLSVADVAIVTSGTATLETALLRVPQVVCYTANSISFAIAKRIVNIKYISLVNLIMDKPVVKELIQKDFSMKTVDDELQRLLFVDDYKKIMMDNYDALINILGESGASEATATGIWTELSNDN